MQTSHEIIKIVLVGDEGVGKTQLVKELAEDRSDSAALRQLYKSSIGIDYQTKTVVNPVTNITYDLQYWDISGKEEFRKLTRLYYKDTAFVALVFSMIDQASFDHLPTWLAELKEHAPQTAQYFLLANKVDMINYADPTSCVSIEAAQAFATQNNLMLIATSAKTRRHLNNFEDEIERLLAIAPTPNSPYAIRQQDLIAKIEAFKQKRPDNQTIQEIGAILKTGLHPHNVMNQQGYFEQKFAQLKKHINTLQKTSKSLLNTALNVIVTVLLAVSVVGLPLAHFFGLLKANEQASGHKLMFFAFGAKQAAQIACHQVFEGTNINLIRFS